MDDGAITNYLDVDYKKAVNFYDERAKSSKRWYRGLSVYLIVVSAILTPIVAFAPDNVCWRIVAAALSTSIVISTGLLAHLKCHENWLSYRGFWDALERERRLFQTSAGKYLSAENKSALFVESIEAILTKEGADFYSRHARGEEQKEEREKRE